MGWDGRAGIGDMGLGSDGSGTGQSGMGVDAARGVLVLVHSPGTLQRNGGDSTVYGPLAGAGLAGCRPLAAGGLEGQWAARGRCRLGLRTSH